MKSIEKVKRKLKFVKWMDKHSGKVILIGGMLTMFLGEMLAPFMPLVALPLMLTSFLFISVGGFLNIIYANNKDLEILLEKQIKAMENVSEKEVQILSRSIEFYQKHPEQYVDEKSTKRLIKELIIIKTSAEMALKEKKEIENHDQEENNELGI